MKFGSGHDLPDAKALKGAAAAWAQLMGETVAEVRGTGYDTGGLPIFTPATWAIYRDHESTRQHHPADCVVCAYFAELEIAGYVAPWRDGPPMLLPGRPRWNTAESALEHYWTIKQDGYPSGSVTGSIVAFGALGCWTQQESRDGSVAERMADDVAAVESALVYAFRDHQAWRHYAAIVIARRGMRSPIDASELAASMGMRVVEIGAVVRKGMRGVRANLAARGLIPMPRNGSRDRVEALELRAKMERQE
jgi:hypothetical protein